MENTKYHISGILELKMWEIRAVSVNLEGAEVHIFFLDNLRRGQGRGGEGTGVD